MFKKIGWISATWSLYRSACDVMFVFVRNEPSDTSSIPDKADCISHSTNTLWKDMNPIILPPVVGK